MKSVVEPFEKDALANEGYVYTTSQKPSSRLALDRMEALMLEGNIMSGRRVLDAGCGDGYFTRRFYDKACPSRLVAVDAAKAGVAVARNKSGSRAISFLSADLERSPFTDDSFDLVVLQGVLHHVDNPRLVIAEAFRVAPRVVILEPNGNNLGLKLIEKVSRYHRDHSERSYTSSRLKSWIREAGAVVERTTFGGFVPLFCPSGVAGAMKRMERPLERAPLIRAIGCAQIVLVGRR